MQPLILEWNWIIFSNYYELWKSIETNFSLFNQTKRAQVSLGYSMKNHDIINNYKKIYDLLIELLY